MTAPKPATALPWRVGPASTIEGNRLGQRGVWSDDKKLGIADAYGCARHNAAYIVHACNAYPKLVAVIREDLSAYLGDFPPGHAATKLRDLLRELGEEA